jgi:hypothetical protein
MSLKDFVAKRATERQAVEIARLKSDLHLARNESAGLLKRLHEAERIREGVFHLTATTPDPPVWLRAPSSNKKSPHVAVLVTSDFQWGERIKASNMDGLNAYSVAIAEKRYRYLIDRTIDISLEHLPKHSYDGLIYLRLGDGVSGEIHADLRESNEMGGPSATRSLVASETAGLERLAEAFARVHVVSVSGNHGRVTPKPQAKRAGYENFDAMAAWWLEDIFRKDKRVTFQTPESIDAVFNVHGRRFLATHGDNMGSRGGEGFIGPAATILRGMKRTHDQYARTGMTLYKIFCGHFHTAYDLGLGWSNGSLPGYSEYARHGRMTPEPPLQWLIMLHHKYGATSAWPILVEPAPIAKVERRIDFVE